jgi:imidazolonepropionase-like amidohydrolase
MPRLDNKYQGGFVDAHVHIRAWDALETVRSAGITAVRDAGMRQNAEHGLPFHRPLVNGPLVVSSGWALYKQGGYGASFGIPAGTREEIRAEILKLKAAGADIIKVMASGMVSLKNPGTITPGGFSRDQLSFIVEEAQRSGLGVMAHANGEQAIMDVARAGVRSVEHGFFMTARALEVMAERGTFWTPTTRALARAADAGPASDEGKMFITGLIGSHREMIRQAHDIGVSLAVGTDCVLPDADYRAAYDAELLSFEQAGLSRDAVMAIACEGGAKLLGLDNFTAEDAE